MATFFTVSQVKDHALTVNDGKGASYTRNDKAGTTRLYNAIVNAMEVLSITKVESRKDFSLGHLAEGVHNCALNGAHTGRYAKAFAVDFMEGKIEVEVKVSANSKDLATPLVKAVRVHLLTPKGWVLITKAQVKEVFSNPDDFTDYVKFTKDGSGFRFKTKATELGTPIKSLNEVFGF